MSQPGDYLEPTEALDYTTATPKLCIDCKFSGVAYRNDNPLQRAREILICTALAGKTSPVTGSPMGGKNEVSMVRSSTICGWGEAKLFQPKEKE